MERPTREIDERVAELELALDDLRATTAAEALELRARLRSVQQRVGEIEAGKRGEATAEELNKRRQRIADAKAKLSGEDIDRIREERARARAAEQQA